MMHGFGTIFVIFKSRIQEEGSAVLLDLRSEQSFEKSYIKGAINLPVTELTDEALIKVIPSKNSRVVIYCDNNFQMSRKVALTTMAYPAIKQLGYKNIFILESSFSNEIFPLLLKGSPN